MNRHQTERIGSDRYTVNLPDPSTLPEPLATAARELTETQARLRQARRDRDAAASDVHAAENEAEIAAGETAMQGAKLPKDARRKIKAAHEALEYAELAVVGETNAYRQRYAALVATLEANIGPLQAWATEKADLALKSLAAARMSWERASVASDTAFGILGLVTEPGPTGHLEPLVRERTGSRRAVDISTALAATQQALGATALELERAKRGPEAIDALVAQQRAAVDKAKNASDSAAVIQAERAARAKRRADLAAAAVGNE